MVSARGSLSSCHAFRICPVTPHIARPQGSGKGGPAGRRKFDEDLAPALRTPYGQGAPAHAPPHARAPLVSPSPHLRVHPAPCGPPGTSLVAHSTRASTLPCFPYGPRIPPSLPTPLRTWRRQHSGAPCASSNPPALLCSLTPQAQSLPSHLVATGRQSMCTSSSRARNGYFCASRSKFCDYADFDVRAATGARVQSCARKSSMPWRCAPMHDVSYRPGEARTRLPHPLSPPHHHSG